MDVEEQYEYDDKLGFVSKIQNSKLEIQSNVTMMRNMSSSLAAQTQNNMKMKQDKMELLSRVNEFFPLIHAAKGQVVARNELIFALKKAIEITLARLDPSESLVEVLDYKACLGNKRRSRLSYRCNMVFMVGNR
jgi:hypothetical protein